MGKEKKRNWLTFHFSVFFFSMDTDEYSKVYSEVSSFFPFSFSFSFLLFLLPLLERKSRGKRKKKIAKDNLEKKEKKKRKRKLIIENSSL